MEEIKNHYKVMAPTFGVGLGLESHPHTLA